MTAATLKYMLKLIIAIKPSNSHDLGVTNLGTIRLILFMVGKIKYKMNFEKDGKASSILTNNDFTYHVDMCCWLTAQNT